MFSLDVLFQNLLIAKALWNASNQDNNDFAVLFLDVIMSTPWLFPLSNFGTVMLLDVAQ